jgi:adenylate cyclase
LPDKPSIAVLPFANISGDPEQEYFADGMVEEIITTLSRIRWLFVIARNSSFTYKGQAIDVKRVGRELGVRYVLEGSVRKAGGRVRITAQLINATTSTHLWADRFDGAIDDVFDLQDKVATSVAGVIEPALQAAEIERARQKRPESLDAYDLYLRALAEFDRLTEESSARALALLGQAIKIDPRYGAAMALAAHCFARRRLYQWMTDEEKETAEGTHLARSAIAAARDDATVLATASFASWNLNADPETALRTLDRAIELNPNLAIAWGFSGIVHAYAGDSAVAIERCARAMRLSPLDPSRWIFLFATGIAHLSERHLDEALVWLSCAHEERPDFPTLLALRASTLAHLGRLKEARGMLQQLLAEAPRTIVTVRRGTVFFKNAAVWAFIWDGLRLAGVPEE